MEKSKENDTIGFWGGIIWGIIIGFFIGLAVLAYNNTGKSTTIADRVEDFEDYQDCIEAAIDYTETPYIDYDYISGYTELKEFTTEVIIDEINNKIKSCPVGSLTEEES